MLLKRWIYIILFAFGISIGSFINVLEMRMFKRDDFIKTPSHCPKCKHKLNLLDLIPIFSFFFLKGHCRYCGTKVSWQYPIVEFISGILFLLSGVYITIYMHITNISTLFYTIILSIFLGLNLVIFLFFALYDVKHQIVPNQVILPLIIYALIFNSVVSVTMHFYPNAIFLDLWSSYSLLWNIVSGVSGGAFIALIIFLTKGKGMGGGDLKLVVYMGLILGLKGLIVAFYIAVISGSIIGILWGIKKKRLKGLKLPFALFLSFGAIISFFYADKVTDIYLHFLNI